MTAPTETPATTVQSLSRWNIECEKQIAAIVPLSERLDRGDQTVTDDGIRQAFKNGYYTNCSSVAEGEFEMLANLCVGRPHLVQEFLPRTVQSLYGMGVDDIEPLQRFIRFIVRKKSLYLVNLTSSGRTLRSTPGFRGSSRWNDSGATRTGALHQTESKCGRR